MENYMVIRGEKIELSEETVRNLEEKFGIKKKRWVPKEGEEYWFIEDDGDVSYDTYDEESKIDEGRITFGNVFRTKEEPELIARKLKALKRIMDWKFEQQGDWKPDWKDHGQFKYYIYFSHGAKRFDALNSCHHQHDRLIGYFKADEIAIKCIKECDSDLKIIFDIEE